MDPDSDRKIEKQGKEINPLQRYFVNAGDVFSSVWVRCCAIYFDIDNRKYLESQYYYVFHIGSIFYFLFFIAQTFK
jgi:hypothetical protein